MTDPSPPATSARELVHRVLREQLGRYAEGQLGDVESGAIASHLECCESCRAEVPAVPSGTSALPADAEPADAVPADAAVASDEVVVGRRARHRGAARSVRTGAAAGLVLAVGLVALGVALGAQLAAPREVIRTVTLPAPVSPVPATTTPPALPTLPTRAVEAVRWAETGVDLTALELVSEPWGLEVTVEGSGFVADEVYRTVVRTKRGRDLPAGEFLGTGDATLRAVLHAAVPRDGASGFSILDARGVPVAQSRFPAT